MGEAAAPRRRSFREQVDLLALVVVQPVVAAFAAVGLLGDRTEAQEVTRPFLVWGGLLLLALIFAEGVWSFASRHMRRQGLGKLWVKLVGAGLCAILSFAAAYRHLGLIDGGVVTHKAGVALYFSITAWTTVGFGDVVATVQARPFAAAQALAGFVFNSALIGLMLHALTVTNIAAAREETRNLS
jgi:hypothetical protein